MSTGDMTRMQVLLHFQTRNIHKPWKQGISSFVPLYPCFNINPSPSGDATSTREIAIAHTRMQSTLDGYFSAQCFDREMLTTSHQRIALDMVFFGGK